MMDSLSRRSFLKLMAGALAAPNLPDLVSRAESNIRPQMDNPTNMPNIILAMTDDQGWGDTGYNGHKHLKTPNLDAMSKAGIRFERFYSASPVCSPTRGSCLTGRHPHRYGIFSANVGHMPREEITLAEALKTRGYTTGFFGKWHLGTLTKTVLDSNRGGRPGSAEHYSPPWENGFDVCFATEAKVPTWNPMKEPGTGKPYGTYYWNEEGARVAENLEGDDSRVIMDRAIPFMQKAVAEKMPFLAVIWFHTPHLPVYSTPGYKAMYAGHSEGEQNFWGAITAMDAQVGRLRSQLRKLGIADSTMMWFCSDNGPEGNTQSKQRPGSTKGLRGRKRDLFEGGIRVPGILEWPAKINRPSIATMPCSTLDYYPTILDLLGIELLEQPYPIDGVSLLPLIEGKMAERPGSIGFEFRDYAALIDNRYKLVTELRSGRVSRVMLFDITSDVRETRNLAAEEPDVAEAMKTSLESWRAYCKESLAGEDYRVSVDVTPRGKESVTWGKVKQDRLLQNYPNPFNPETWIPYELSQDKHVVISIHDIRGKLVRALDLGKRSAGIYVTKDKAAYWDGKNEAGEYVSSGICFYTITADGFSATRKMIVKK